MKEIIPLKKDIVFKSKIGSLSNINLDHDYKIEEDIVSGTVALSGTYKMTEASIYEDDFFYTIPFSIAISKKVDKDTIKIEIDDFKYDVEGQTLKLNIDLELTCENIEEIQEKKEENDDLDEYINDYFADNKVIDLSEKEDILTTEKQINTNIDINNELENITNNIINTENKYYTYKIYIVRENDTIENICTKYNITYEELKNYNDLSEINIGDKIIIPSFNE